MANFHLMAKPFGPTCNLNCTYCFYLEKKQYYNYNITLMNEDVLETYIKNYISSQESDIVEFTWQGGEPTLAGIEFFKNAIKLQRKYQGKKRISNSLQTNGTLINEKWCSFLKKHNFLVGLSIDGPKAMHSHYRKFNDGSSSFSRVKNTIRLLKKYEIDFNVLTTVNDINSKEPDILYDFYKEMEIKYVQFIPIVEKTSKESSIVTSWSVDSNYYGEFLISIFNRWIKNDVGEIYFMNFEWALNSAITGISGTCHFAKKCGTAGIIEHSGDVYSCDHYVYPENKLGNIMDDDVLMLFRSPKQQDFGNKKEEQLSIKCKSCEVLHLCYGGCPKHRFVQGQNYLCDSYKKFFKHILPYAKKMEELINNGKPVTLVMCSTQN